MNLGKIRSGSCNFLAVLRVKGGKFGQLFDLVLIGDARQLEVFTLTGILPVGVLIKQDIVQFNLLIN